MNDDVYIHISGDGNDVQWCMGVHSGVRLSEEEMHINLQRYINFSSSCEV